MKHYLSLAFLVLVVNTVFGQTLFTYGDMPVSKQDFLTAFNKNPPSKEESRKALDEYLGLYINYKLKVQAGYDEELNKQPSFIDESKNFKHQIAENVINEEVGIKSLSQEAMIRSMKDLHVLALEEKPILTHFINAGIYVLEPSVLNLVSKDTYFDMPQLIKLAKEKKYKINAFPIHEYWQDLGYPETLLQTAKVWK
jgi:hypothetical protein